MMINIYTKIKDIVDKYPETISVFYANGFDATKRRNL